MRDGDTVIAIGAGRQFRDLCHALGLNAPKPIRASPRTRPGSRTASSYAPARGRVARARRTGKTAGADRWRYDEARVRLAYGEWLRRAKANLPAQTQLLMAKDLFAEMDATP